MHRDVITGLKPIQALFAFALLNTFSDAAFACTLCHTETGKQVRSGIFGSDFGFNLLITFIPFAVFLGITALIYFGIPTVSIRSRTTKRAAVSSRPYAKGETS